MDFSSNFEPEKTEMPRPSETKELASMETQKACLDIPVEEPAKSLHCPIEGSAGHWQGKRGESTWVPDPESVLTKCNPEGASWGEISHRYNVTGIDFHNGEPDFKEVCKGEVMLDERMVDRGMVFNAADYKMAEERGCSPSEVRGWRRDNAYTWHEKSDGITVQKVPSIIHGNIVHIGGHSANIHNQFN